MERGGYGLTVTRIKPVCQYSWYSVDIRARNLANETLEYYCCGSLHCINKSFQILLGDMPSLLLAEKTVKCNVFVGLGLISDVKLLISHCGSLGSVQVRSCGISAAQIILWGSLFSKYFTFFLLVILHPWSILISYYHRYETGTLGAQYQGSLCPLIISTAGVGELHWDGDVGTTVGLGAESHFPYTGTTSMIAMLLIQPEESVDCPCRRTNHKSHTKPAI